MIIIEFDSNLTDNGLNILKYRNVEDANWNYLYIDVETLNLLVTNFGIISTVRCLNEYIQMDTPNTPNTINIRYCGAAIQMFTCNKTSFYIPDMVNNY
jgi:hypothetical protein